MKAVVLVSWLAIPLGLWFAYVQWGTPHVIVSYRFHDNGRSYDPRAPRHYINCTYFGVHGVRLRPAVNASCPWVRMIKVGS